MYISHPFVLSRIAGNDSATRDCCSILWVANPEETYFFIHLMLDRMNSHGKGSVVDYLE